MRRRGRRGNFGWRVAVEDCPGLGAGEFARVVFKQRATAGDLRWKIGMGVACEAEWFVEVGYGSRDDAVIVLQAHRQDDQRLRLERSTTNIGQPRYWWRCPSYGCNRRVAKVYQASERGRFACRVCHQLTYRSTQESGKPMIPKWLAKRAGVEEQVAELERLLGRRA